MFSYNKLKKSGRNCANLSLYLLILMALSALQSLGEAGTGTMALHVIGKAYAAPAYTAPASVTSSNTSNSNAAFTVLPQARPKNKPATIDVEWQSYLTPAPHEKMCLPLAEATEQSPPPALQDCTRTFADAYAALGSELANALTQNRIWLVLTLKPTTDSAYFYAPFALGQTKAERLATADAVLPTTVQILENGVATNDIEFYYPPGELKDDPFSGLQLPVYTGATMLVAPLPSHLLLTGTKSLAIRALLCTESSCTPLRLNIEVDLGLHNLKVAPLPELQTRNFTAYRKPNDLKEQANELTATGTSPANQAETEPQLSTGTPLASVNMAAPQYGDKRPDIENTIDNQKIQRDIDNFISSLEPQYFLGGLEVQSLGLAILFGLFAGLILNFMPCVLPVITLKLGMLAGLGGWRGLNGNAPGTQEIRKRFRSYNLFFCFGLFAWFAILFALLGSADMLWGQFFQKPEFITGMALLLFTLALSLFGVFNLPILAIKESKSSSLKLQAFSSGLLATLLATPCSGPLLGGVLGWGINQPLPYLAICLFSVAFGMALPFICMIIKPELGRFLPRPGNWTFVLEKLMGFALLGAVLYLITLLPGNNTARLFGALLLLAFGVWLWGRGKGLLAQKSSLKHLPALAIRCTAVLLVLFALFVPFYQEAPNTTNWQNFDYDILHQKNGTENTLLLFTADWCINCKALEHTTLTDKNTARWHKKYQLNFMKADITQESPLEEALLKQMGSSSIPLIAIFPSGEQSRKPVVLRDIVSSRQLEDALEATLNR